MWLDIIFLDLAERQIDEAYMYGWIRYGLLTANQFMHQVMDDIERLASHPYIGKVEPYLEGRAVCYRSLVVHRHYKVVYFVNEELGKLYIASLWDTRRDPERMKREIGDDDEME